MSNLDEGLEFQPPAKRRRKSLTSDEVEPESTLFWFQEDGDIVLGVEDKYLKVHRTRLMGSLVFSTMLGLPQPELTETLGDCPLVRLPHDTLHDWIPVLDWIYDRRRATCLSVHHLLVKLWPVRLNTDLQLWT